MLIDQLKNHPAVGPFCCEVCEEHEVMVTLDPAISKRDVVIIKVDEYYNSLNLASPPKSPDCFFVVACTDGSYAIYIAELKNIVGSKRFSIQDIREKFQTCILDFMLTVLGEYFRSDSFHFKAPRLFFVSDPTREKGKPDPKGRLTRTKALEAANTRPLRFRDYKLGIEHKIPSPAVPPC